MCSPPESPLSASRWQRTLKGRYKILEAEVLGEGASATVYKGLDTEACKNVAVKLYRSAPGDTSGLNASVQSIQVFEAIFREKGRAKGVAAARGSKRSSSSSNHSGASLLDGDLDLDGFRSGSKTSQDSAGIKRYKTEKFLSHMDVRQFFVQLLDYSKTDDGEPGLDSEEEVLFLVFEIGVDSLGDTLEDCSKAGKSLSSDELRKIQWTLVSIVWGLHAVGYVHLDIKPQNVMRFDVDGESQWKLIDLDGAVPTGSVQQLQGITFTPEYMPPELAYACLTSCNSPSLKPSTLVVSRLMDVWSVGMCALEAVFLQPVLQPFYKQWSEETGDDTKFFEWLADSKSDAIVSGDMKEHIVGIHEDMADLLEGMLVREPSNRFCIGQCLAHKWFEPMRQKAAVELSLLNSGAGDAVSRACILM